MAEWLWLWFVRACVRVRVWASIEIVHFWIHSIGWWRSIHRKYRFALTQHSQFLSAEYGIETPTGDSKDLSNLSISNLRTTNPNIATTSTTTTNPSYTHKPTNDTNYCLYKYNEFNECNNLMQNSSNLHGKNHVVQKNTFFKSFTRSSSFCRIKVNPKKFRNISFKFRKSDKVCCTPDYTATTASATSSQVRGKFIQIETQTNEKLVDGQHQCDQPNKKEMRFTFSTTLANGSTSCNTNEWKI